jgi:hypothetical protein
LDEEKEKKNLQPPKLAEPPKVKETINEEAIKNFPIIQDLNIKITALAEALSGSLTEVNKKFESYDIQIKDTNEKITALGQAVSVLNEEFSNFMKDLQAKLAPPPAIAEGDNTPPGTSIVSSKRVEIEKPSVAESPPAPATTGDKLLQWANLLAGLASSGAPSSGGGANATDLLKLVLQLQDNAEERALKRLDTSIKSITMIANLLTGKKIEVPEETKAPIPHL